ncbi:AraC family transcriptional regulator ligand-binding domain-containing protein [Salicola sp. Rm-C-2C1-2]|uniref:AraC family transcriptional regulator n=1 Tax=Salicola sp. Rm-C-2C1-2 TaxID=3141321 RepID=UPI0032E3C96E
MAVNRRLDPGDIPDHWRSQDERHLPAHYQPALLIELARARGMADHRLLRHTGLFLDDILAGEALISDRQYRRLITNVQHHGAAEELALLWGRQLLPGHYGALTPLLQHAPNLAQALQGLYEHRHHLCPLLAPQWWHDRQWGYLLWINGGAGRARSFVSRAMMAAVYGLFRHRSGRVPDWYFLFSQSHPTTPEAHEVNLGQRVHFTTGVDMIIMPLQDLNVGWADSSPTAFSVARHQLAGKEATVAPRSTLPEALYHLLIRHAEAPPDLNTTAHALAMSPSSLKRRLRDCDTHFQSLHDEARLHYSLYLSQVLGLDMDAIAERLSHGDRANFRRSFRRWTGMTPAHFQMWLMP